MRKLNQHKSTIVSLFLTGFISVFVCDLLCNTGLIFPKHHISHKVADTGHHTNNQSHHEESGHDHHHATDHHHDDKHDHEPGEDDCCDDMVNSIYASLIKETSESVFKAPASPLIYQTQVADNTPVVFHQKLLSLLYTDLPPPPSGFERRVLIQSFLN